MPMALLLLLSRPMLLSASTSGASSHAVGKEEKSVVSISSGYDRRPDIHWKRFACFAASRLFALYIVGSFLHSFIITTRVKARVHPFPLPYGILPPFPFRDTERMHATERSGKLVP